MNKILLTLAAVMLIGFTACAQNKGEKEMKTANKTLVVYFSATGNTAKVAKEIAAITNGTLAEIQSEQAYTTADLNWNDKQSRSSVEMNNAKARPALKKMEINTNEYDVIFIGYPIWWNQAPRIINSFIENNDLQGKTIVPFATSGGSGISNSVNELKKIYPNLQWEGGKLLNRATRADIQRWVNSLL